MAKSCWAISFTKYITNYEKLNVHDPNKSVLLNIRKNHDNKQVLMKTTITTFYTLMRWNKLPVWWTSVAGSSHSRIQTLLRPFSGLLPCFGFPARELQRCIVQGICFPVLQQRTVLLRRLYDRAVVETTYSRVKVKAINNK